MRILSVSHFFETHGGGIERVAGHLCRRFARAGYQVGWAASASDPAPSAPLDIVPLSCWNPTERFIGLPMPIPGPRAMARLARAVRNSDLVIVHDALYATSIATMLLARHYRKRSVLIQHIAGIPFSSPFLRGLMRLANRLVTRPMLKAADERVFISDTVRHDLLGPSPSSSYTLLFNGVDTSVFFPPKNLAAPSTGSRRVLFIGRYVEKKGLAVLRALARLRPDFTVLMAGSGPIRPESWGLANIRNLGVQDPRSLANLYREADVLLLPSVGEGYPLVIQEAMACGTAVVCGAPTHRADPDAAHWLCGVPIELADPEGSAGRCAEAIDSLALTSTDRAAMAAYAAKRYDWAKMAAQILDLVPMNAHSRLEAPAQ